MHLKGNIKEWDSKLLIGKNPWQNSDVGDSRIGHRYLEHVTNTSKPYQSLYRETCITYTV